MSTIDRLKPQRDIYHLRKINEQTKSLQDCVSGDKLKVDIEDATISGTGLATEPKQDTMINLLQGQAPALNRTQAIPVQIMVGDSGSNYDALRASGQDLLVMVDDMNPDVALNSGLARSDYQTDGSQKAQILGNTAKDGSGTSYHPVVTTDGYLRVDVASSAAGGDATAANQATMISELQTLSGTVVGSEVQVDIVSGNVGVTGTVTVDGSGVTQPVSGTVAVSSVSGTVSVDGSGVTQPVSGTVAVSSVGGTVSVDGSGVTQPVSGTVAVSSVGGTVSVDGSGVTQPVSGTVAVSSVGGTVSVDGSGVTQPISASSLPLPTNAATAAKQPALGTAGTASSDVLSVQGIASMTPLVVDGSASTQPVSGTVAVSSVGGTVSVDGSGVTQPISASSLPLPTNAAIAAKQPALGTAGTASTDVITVQGIGSMTPLVVDGSASTQPVSGTVAVSSVSGTVSVDGSGVTQPVSAASLPLPSNAATSALQTTGNASLATIAGDTTSLDGKVASTSPVSSNGTTSAQAVNMMGTADGTNYRTLKTSGSGVLKTEETLQWTATSILNTTINFGNNANSSIFDLGTDIHVPDDMMLFITDSAGVPYDVSVYTSYNGTNFFTSGTDTTFSSTGGDVMLSIKNDFTLPVVRYLQVNIANTSTDTNSTFTITLGEYNGS